MNQTDCLLCRIANGELRVRKVKSILNRNLVSDSSVSG